MDKISAPCRSENMRRIRSKNTTPERLVCELVRRLGYRFQLHEQKLPGKPDIVFSRRRKVIFVHGCFWHQHSRCKEGRVPNSRQDYLNPKLHRNVERDRQNRKELRRLGWKSLVIWECELRARAKVERKLTEFLSGDRRAVRIIPIGSSS